MNDNLNFDNEAPLEDLFVEFEAEAELVGLRLDLALRQWVDAIPSRNFGARLIDLGFVTVNGKTPKPSLRLGPGMRVRVDLAFLRQRGAPPHAEEIPLDILFEDPDIIIINKPAGMVVHPGAGVSSGTLVNAILAHCGATLPSLGGPERAGIVHRLDRDTSGVMVVAKSQRALTGLSSQFASHAQERRYLALVQREPVPPQGRIDTWHGRSPRNRLRFAVVPEGQGKRASLRYETLETFLGGAASLQECTLETGRTHQIRVQMQHMNCPLLGDVLYGGDGGPLRARPSVWGPLEKLLVRQMLHAHVLGLEHPGTGCRMRFTAPPPPDFDMVLSFLKAHSESQHF